MNRFAGFASSPRDWTCFTRDSARQAATLEDVAASGSAIDRAIPSHTPPSGSLVPSYREQLASQRKQPGGKKHPFHCSEGELGRIGSEEKGRRAVQGCPGQVAFDSW